MALRKRTDAYWARRSAERLTLAEEESEPYIKQTLKVYEDARRDIVNELKRMYAAYYKKDKGFDKIALNSMAPQGSLRQFRAEMARLKLPTYIPDNYAGRISRLELFESQIRARVAQVGLEQNRIEDKAHRQTVENAYYRSIYDVSRGIGATPAFHQIDQRTIDKILSTKFEGKNYSKRIWSNTNVLAEQLREKLAKSIATGASLEKTVREFTERFNVGETYAKRLICTETNYFENTAEIESYAAMGIEEFVFVATLDNKTSDICQSMDGKKFKVSEAVAGENYPPLHPNCRSTIRAYIGKEYEPETRIYRDPKTGRNRYIYNMDYESWKKEMVKSSFNAEKNTAKNIGVSWKYWRDMMEDSEKTFAKEYSETHNIKWIKKDSRVNQVTGNLLETNDYVDVDENIEYELKTPDKRARYSGIARMVADGAKSGYKKNFMINLRNKKLIPKLKNQLSEYNVRHPNNKIERLKVWSRGREYDIKLKEK